MSPPAPVPSPLVRATGLGKRVDGGRWILDGIGLLLHPGETLWVVGANGAGKSTLLSILVGLVRRSRGEVRVFGADPWRGGGKVRRRIGYVGGDGMLDRRMSGGALLDLALAFHPNPDRAGARRLAVDWGLPLAQRVGRYSDGMARRLLLASAFHAGGDLLVLDEPFRGLDPAMRQSVAEQIGERTRAGAAAIVATHHLDASWLGPGRVLFLEEGRSVLAVDADDLRTEAACLWEIEWEEGHEPPAPPDAGTIRYRSAGSWLVEVGADPTPFLAWTAPRRPQSLRNPPERIDRWPAWFGGES